MSDLMDTGKPIDCVAKALSIGHCPVCREEFMRLGYYCIYMGKDTTSEHFCTTDDALRCPLVLVTTSNEVNEKVMNYLQEKWGK